VRIEHIEGIFFRHVPQYCEQNGVFEYIGMVAGVKGVAVTKHASMVTRKRAICVKPSSFI
jgi:hypothetical protein